MQMGMMGNLFVHPAQDRYGSGGTPGSPDVATVAQRFGGSGPAGYAYNDGDGSTAYDVEVPLQIMGFDPNFHNASYLVQPLPFKDMRDTYFMFNGRGYPDTINPASLTTPPATVDGWTVKPNTQPETALIQATKGDKILLRIVNMDVTVTNTVTVLGIPMRVVGKDARLLRGPTGLDLSYETNSLTLGGGEAFDALLDTTDVDPGTYFVYASNLNYLSNDQEDFGGLMTEIIINNP
jgi:hypothetical protein